MHFPSKYLVINLIFLVNCSRLHFQDVRAVFITFTRFMSTYVHPQETRHTQWEQSQPWCTFTVVLLQIRNPIHMAPQCPLPNTLMFSPTLHTCMTVIQRKVHLLTAQPLKVILLLLLHCKHCSRTHFNDLYMKSFQFISCWCECIKFRLSLFFFLLV